MRVSVTVFIFGLLAAFFALIVEIVTAINPLVFKLEALHRFGLDFSSLLSFTNLLPLVLMALIEEGARFLFLSQYVRRFTDPEQALSWLEKILVGTFFGLGFASLETLLILTGEEAAPALFLSGIILLHVSLSILAAAALTSQKRRFLIPASLGITALIHTLYNLAILIFS